MSNFDAARLNMEDSQLRPNRVTDAALLEAFLTVPRERFVPAHLKGAAYVDEDLPLGGGRYLMEPMVYGRLLMAAAIQRQDNVLEIGAGTGYGAAVLARVARNVVAVEEDASLARQAGANLAALGASNAVVRDGRLGEGYRDRAPYDVIVFAGAVGEIPERVADQLADNGRLVAVVKPETGMARAWLWERARGAFSRRVLFDAGTPLLPGMGRQPSFVF
jgi:protein-L-isoaspartate(D-aspartate) O-methyltransferase